MHEEHIKESNVTIAGMYVNLKKCRFMRTEIEYLGFLVGENRISITSKRTASIGKLKKPESPHDVRSVLGSINYFRKFIPKLATRAAQLHALLVTNVEWRWGDEEETTYNDLVNCLAKEPVILYVPDVNQPFYLDTDASTIAIAGILQQGDEQGDLRVVSCASRRLRVFETN